MPQRPGKLWNVRKSQRMCDEFPYIKVMELGYACVSVHRGLRDDGRLTNCICYQCKTLGLKTDYISKGGHQYQLE